MPFSSVPFSSANPESFFEVSGMVWGPAESTSSRKAWQSSTRSAGHRNELLVTLSVPDVEESEPFQATATSHPEPFVRRKSSLRHAGASVQVSEESLNASEGESSILLILISTPSGRSGSGVQFTSTHCSVADFAVL